MAEFQTNACGTICLCLLNLLAILCLQLWSQPMGPLCLWQCFYIELCSIYCLYSRVSCSMVDTIPSVWSVQFFLLCNMMWPNKSQQHCDNLPPPRLPYHDTWPWESWRLRTEEVSQQFHGIWLWVKRPLTLKTLISLCKFSELCINLIRKAQ